MFGHESLPSRNYTYRAYAPIENAMIVRRQMYFAHQYRNKLVELERDRRARVEAKLTELFPELAALEADVADLEGQIETLLGVIKSENAAAKRKRATPEQRQQLAELKEHRRDAYKVRKTARTEAFESEAWKQAQEEIERVAKEASLLARKQSGLFWGNYLRVETDMQGMRRGAPPVFMGWRGNGTITIQIQGGMTVAEAFDGTDTRLRIDALPPDAYSRKRNGKGRKNLRRMIIRVRCQSRGREPVWAAFPVVLHRPLPEGAMIKWLHIHLKAEHPGREFWACRFVLASAEGWRKPDLAGDGTVGVDVGWRLVPEGLRVAYWVGSDGREGQLVLPNRREPDDWDYLIRKSESLRSIRDREFNAVRDMLADQITMTDSKTLASFPEWFTAGLQHLRQWRSSARLSHFVSRWRTERVAGDEQLWSIVGEPQAGRERSWNDQERHLARWESDNRRHWDRFRADLYRTFAARLSQEYRTIVVETFDLRKSQRSPGPEETRDGAVNEHQREANISLLRQCLRERCAEYKEVPAQDTTRRCNACGHISDFDRRDLIRECPKCGDRHDQDQNAARNLVEAATVTTEPAAA